MANPSVGTLPPRRLLRRWWLSENTHAVFWLIMTIIVIVAYVYAHVMYDGPYEESIEDELNSAVKLYSVQTNDRSKQLELVVGNTVYDPSSDDAGPLGIGQLASVKGLLAETATALERYNTALEDAITHVLNAFQAKTAYPGDMVADLSSIAPEEYSKLLEGPNGPPQEQLFQIRITEPDFRDLNNRAQGEATARLLIETIRRGVVEKVLLSLPPDDTTDEAVATVLRNQSLDLALDAGNEVCERLRELGRDLRPLFGSDDVPAADAGATEGDCEFSNVDSAGTGGERGNGGESTTDCPPGMGCFHATLKKLATEGVGFFWTAGNFRWIEVVALTILGVVVRRLIDFGVIYARLRVVGRRTGPIAQVWDPRETVRTFMYMVYTPILAVAVIWLLTATNLVPADAILFGDWTSHALVPTAFLLGLFPDLGHLLLNRVGEAVFGDVRGTEPPDRSRKEIEPPHPTPGAAAQPDRPTGGADGAGDGPRSLEELRLRLRFIYTSPFR